MTMEPVNEMVLSADRIPATGPDPAWRFIWAHGWGQDRTSMAALAQTFAPFGEHILIDFPGFGDAPPPAEAWGTAEYADWTARVIGDLAGGPPLVWVGYSFGCRVGLQFAARRPELISRLCVIAGAGLPRRRTALEKARIGGKIYIYKALKRLAPLLGMDVDKLRDRFGSADFRNAGAMRGVLTRVVNEDLSDVARQVQCPVQLIYGSDDTETPPEIGERLAALIPGARLAVIDGLDHYSILVEGRHQVARHLRDFLGERQ
jgi:pimeloyl-ACP methyl ester carboxylesterase